MTSDLSDWRESLAVTMAGIFFDLKPSDVEFGFDNNREYVLFDLGERIVVAVLEQRGDPNIWSLHSEELLLEAAFVQCIEDLVWLTEILIMGGII